LIGILVISHEPLGTALIHCTRHIFKKMLPQLAALDVMPDEDPELALQAAKDLMARINDGSGVIVLTDCYGATPSRIAQKLYEPFKVAVVAGVNLPMLTKALTYRREPIEELVPKLIEGGKKSMLLMEPTPEMMPKSLQESMLESQQELPTKNSHQ
jgi:mannose PTS system EIIA component